MVVRIESFKKNKTAACTRKRSFFLSA